MYEIEIYQTESGKSPVFDYLRYLAKNNLQDDLTRIKYCEKLLAEHGMKVNEVRNHTIRLLQDDIYELRPGKHRVFFFYFTGKRFVLLHAYRKSKMEAPKKEIKQAIKEKNDYIRRHKNELSDVR